MASERLRAWAEHVRAGKSGAEAARLVGFSEVTARRNIPRMTKQAVAEGLLPDPAVDRKAVADHEAAVESFMAGLQAELPTAARLLVDVMCGNGVGMDDAGNVIPMPAEQWRALLEFMNRVVGRPAIHIHGHKDQAELDADKNREMRVIAIIKGNVDGI